MHKSLPHWVLRVTQAVTLKKKKNRTANTEGCFHSTQDKLFTSALSQTLTFGCQEEYVPRFLVHPLDMSGRWEARPKIKRANTLYSSITEKLTVVGINELALALSDI